MQDQQQQHPGSANATAPRIAPRIAPGIAESLSAADLQEWIEWRQMDDRAARLWAAFGDADQHQEVAA